MPGTTHHPSATISDYSAYQPDEAADLDREKSGRFVDKIRAVEKSRGKAIARQMLEHGLQMNPDLRQDETWIRSQLSSLYENLISADRMRIREFSQTALGNLRVGLRDLTPAMRRRTPEPLALLPARISDTSRAVVQKSQNSPIGKDCGCAGDDPNADAGGSSQQGSRTVADESEKREGAVNMAKAAAPILLTGLLLFGILGE